MSLATAKARLQLGQLHYMERSQSILLKSDLKSPTIGVHIDGIDDTMSRIQDNDLFDLIQRLDKHLHAQVNNEDYESALENALEMQKHAPESYYGFHREAQIRLIRNEYGEAFRVYTHGYKKVVNGVQLLHKSAEDAQHLFDQAAVELAKTDQYDEANKTANWMISLLPTSPTGYIRAGGLYEMQGEIKAAMEVYEQGMSCVPAEHRKLLTERMTCIQERLAQTPHYDFIVQMPLEITSEVAQYLIVSDLIECLKVSRSWKERIEQCAEAWRVLKVEPGGRNINVNAIQNVKRFVRQVAIKTTSANQPLVKNLLVSMGNGEFESLTNLNFDYSRWDIPYIPQLAKVLDHADLTCLDLTFSRDHIPLHQVLQSCCHLTRLIYRTSYFDIKINYDLLPKEPTMITHLSIGSNLHDLDKTVTPHFFLPLIPIFPHLISLSISDNTPGDLITIIENCSNLRQLAIEQQPYDQFLDFPDAESTSKGLQHLRLKGHNIGLEDVVDVIDRNSETLISIHLELHIEDGRDTHWTDPDGNWKNNLKLMKCGSLKRLCCFFNCNWPYEQWIGDCPALEEIILKGVTELTDSIFDTLKRIPNLRSLELEDCNKLTDAGFSEFFKNLQKQGSQLHTVAIRFCPLLSTDTLLSLMSLHSLRNLGIYACTGVTKTVFHDFATKASSSNSIELVTLNMLDGVTDQPLLELVLALPRLQWLSLCNLDSITDSSIRAIAEVSSMTSSLRLNIYYCSQITRSAIDNAREFIVVNES